MSEKITTALPAEATGQLTLPYFEIKKEDIATRDQIRKDKDISYGSLANYKIPFNRIKLRDGYNDRTIYEGIEELADSIFAYGGLKEPMKVDALKNGDFLTDEGHRRWHACQLLIEQGRGACIEKVDTIINSRDLTELQRKINIAVGNMHQHQLKPIDQAKNAYEIKYNFGKEYSNDEVAELLGYSRQKVDYLILIWEQPDEIKNEIRKGSMSFNEVVKLIRANRKAAKQNDQAEKESHQTASKLDLTPPDLLKNDLKELDKLENKGQNAPEDAGLLSDFMEEDEENLVEELNLAEELNDTKYNEGEKVSPTSPMVQFQPGDGEIKFDTNREEILWCNNIIKLLDKLDVVANKLPDQQTGQDMSKMISWATKDALEVRLYVHKTNKINKKDF